MGPLGKIMEGLSTRPHEVAPFFVLVFPLVGFIVLSLFGDAIKKEGKSDAAGPIASAMALLSFLFAVLSVKGLFKLEAGMLAQGKPGEGHAEHVLAFAQPWLGFDWIDAGGLQVPLSLLLDPLSAVMILTVTGVGSLIHIYSIGYMSHDEDRVRYFSYLNLFFFFMLLLVLGGSLPLLFVGWEGVGLCSYLLIGFWYKKKSASDAGLKAFVVNRIGDAGLILGMALAFFAFGTLDLVDLANNVSGLGVEKMGQFGVITVICLLLFVGATGKSAQIPLHVWLPDAMEGPTPVSALIHAATMVTAGVYMVSRLAPLYSRSATAMMVVAVIGCATALMAATVAMVQTDIKRVLAYSTVSQLGYMFLACGVGAFGYGVFHLFTHAFFKALLFLGSGSVIHALSGEQDMRQMGGLWKKIPWTAATFVVGTLAIAGIPPLAGFWSKDAILGAAFEHHQYLLFGVAFFTALLTSFYMSRLTFLTFFGSYRGGLEKSEHLAAAHDTTGGHATPAGQEPPAAHGDHGHADAHGSPGGGHGHGGHGGIHESPWSMLGPLVILAIGSIGVGFLKIPHFVEPVFRLDAAHGAHPAWLPYLATLSAVLGIAGAWYAYLLYPDLPGRVRQSLLPLQRVLEAKWGFDLAYNWFAGRAVVGGSDAILWRAVDAGLIDGAVNGTATAVGAVSRSTRGVQTGLVRGYVLVMLMGAVVLLGYLLWS